MRKLFKLFSLLVAMTTFVALQSCSGDKGQLLEYVPADASIIVYGDFNYVMEKSGISSEGKIGEPLRSVLEDNRIDLSEYKKETELVKDFTNEAVFFMSGQKLWIIFGLKDSDNIEEYLKKEQDFDLSKESKVTVLTKKGRSLMIKDNMLFLCMDIKKDKPVDDVEGVNDLCKLGKDSFAKSDNTKELAKKIVEKDHTMFAIANINKIASLVNDRDFDQFKMGLSMVYKNPTYICADLTVNDKGIFATAKVLNSDYKPAECTIPTGQIDTKAFSYATLPGNSALVALALPSNLINQICNLASKALPSESISLIKCLNGTAAMAFSPTANSKKEMYAVALTTGSTADATKLGNFLSQMDSSIKCSTSDKYLRISSRTTPAPTGNAAFANILQGKAAGCVMDLSATAKALGLGGDYSDLGISALYAEKIEKSLVLKFEWKCANPVAKIFSIISNAEAIERSLGTIDNLFYDQSYDYSASLDTVPYEEEYTWEEEEYSYAEPEPDYLY